MEMRNPEEQATKRQLWLLHILTKSDTRDWQITKQDAYGQIAELLHNKSSKKQSKEYEQYCQQTDNEVKVELLSSSPLYNTKFTIPVTKGKGKRVAVKKRLIDCLVTKEGDLLEQISIKAFNNINSCQLQPALIQSNGKIDINDAVDELYSELGYKSDADMLTDVEATKKLQRSLR